ncbi:MAG: isocitrate lyase/phosphoenolpyruvate mutase family protein [Pseudomonadota bacterium]
MQTASTAEKLKRFRSLHGAGGAFLMPNAWDAGSARLLASLDFPALATTSAGLAFALGLRDSTGSVTREAALANARAIVEATDLPISADLENGLGPLPEDCAQTLREAEAVGLCGAAFEDASGDPDRPIYDFGHAVERIEAVVAAKTNPDFMVTARSENFLYGRPDLDDTIKRLQAFEKAGADVVYAPGLPDIESVRAVCQAVSVPVNVLGGLTNAAYTVEDLSEAGVRRISTGASLARAARGEMMRGARELRDTGTFEYAKRAIPDAEASQHMRVSPPARG